MNTDFSHKMRLAEALAKVEEHYGYIPLYVFEGREIDPRQFWYAEDEDVLLIFDVEHGSKVDNSVEIMFKDMRKLLVLPF